ncbi:MAG: M64 family metallopeptidase, partial [Thermoanaerobaculia bacterium]
MLHAETYFGKVGAFRGAAYEAKGLYRPEVDCVM